MKQILTGDCMDILPTLEAGSVQTCVTSPPYWGLRDYGTSTWEGGNAVCDHANGRQGATRRDVSPEPLAERALMYGTGTGNGSDVPPQQYRDVCPKCGARRIDSQLGLESTPEEYLAKMVAVFREVWRVLRDDGTLWVNMGDSYATNGYSAHSKNENAINGGLGSWNGATCGQGAVKTVGNGLKQKDLCMMPARLAMALQADGWYLRSEIVWAKPNPMPEIVTDRPTKSHEMIYLLAKQPKYFYDADAIREPHAEPWRGNGDHESGNSHTHSGFIEGATWVPSVRQYNPSGRNKRTVWTVATQPYSEAHFATFPEDLIKPCILAGSGVGDTVLDPFAGSGTTGMVALELGRKAVLIELNPKYVELIKDRTNVTAGML